LPFLVNSDACIVSARRTHSRHLAMSTNKTHEVVDILGIEHHLAVDPESLNEAGVVWTPAVRALASAVAPIIRSPTGIVTRDVLVRCRRHHRPAVRPDEGPGARRGDRRAGHRARVQPSKLSRDPHGPRAGGAADERKRERNPRRGEARGWIRDTRRGARVVPRRGPSAQRRRRCVEWWWRRRGEYARRKGRIGVEGAMGCGARVRDFILGRVGRIRGRHTRALTRGVHRRVRSGGVPRVPTQLCRSRPRSSCWRSR
jgi:hypothetical protein